MIARQYKEMLEKKSVIRQLSEYAIERGKVIGYENVFDYSLGNPSVPAPDEFSKVCIDMLQKKDLMELHGYSQSQGIPTVREKIAQSLNRRFGMEYTSEHIFMTSGAAGAVAHAIRCVSEPGEEVITFAPFFPEYYPYVELSGAVLRVVSARTEDFQINFSEFEEMLNRRTAAVLINTPNNPSGIVYTEKTLKKLAEILEKKQKEYGHEIFLISDEPYREIVFSGVKSPYVSQIYDNTLCCYSFSKSLSLPGERIGYIAVNPKCKDDLYISKICAQISRGIGHNCPASLIQLVVAEILNKTADLSVYEKNRDILYKKLIELGFECVKPGGTFYIFPRALEEDAVIFCEKAKKYDLILVPGDSFYCPGYFRMAYCIDTEKVERSLVALQAFVEKEYGRKVER